LITFKLLHRQSRVVRTWTLDCRTDRQ